MQRCGCLFGKVSGHRSGLMALGDSTEDAGSSQKEGQVHSSLDTVLTWLEVLYPSTRICFHAISLPELTLLGPEMCLPSPKLARSLTNTCPMIQ